MGYGNKPNASDELTYSGIDKLYEHSLLGTHAPLPLTNLLNLTLTLVLGMRDEGSMYKYLKIKLS